MAEFELKNVGPIKELEINAPPGKVTVLRGPNGSGKSTALTALGRLSGGKKAGSITKRDNALKGHVKGAGVMMRVTVSGCGKSDGKLEFEPVDEDLTIADVVEPGVKDPVSADKKRIEAICALLGVDPDVDLFADAFEGCPVGIDDVVSEKAEKASDVVAMARQLKSDADSVARRIEAEADDLKEELAGLRVAVDGVDLTAECDPELLEQAVQKAMDELSTLRAAVNSAESAKASLPDGDLPPVDVLRKALDALLSAEADREKRLAVLREQREELADELRRLDEMIADNVRVGVENDTETDLLTEQIKSSQMRSVIEKQVAECPTADQIGAAEQAVAKARVARDMGVLVRKAKESHLKIEQTEAKIEAVLEKAGQVREAGRRVSLSLAKLLDGTGLSVEESGRLVTEHPVRGETYYSELSDGERWELAIRLVVEAAERRGIVNGLLIIPQIAWEGLDDTGRAVVCQAVEGTGLSVVAAEAFGERGKATLHSEVLQAT